MAPTIEQLRKQHSAILNGPGTKADKARLLFAAGVTMKARISDLLDGYSVGAIQNALAVKGNPQPEQNRQQTPPPPRPQPQAAKAAAAKPSGTPPPPKQTTGQRMKAEAEAEARRQRQPQPRPQQQSQQAPPPPPKQDAQSGYTVNVVDDMFRIKVPLDLLTFIEGQGRRAKNKVPHCLALAQLGFNDRRVSEIMGLTTTDVGRHLADLRIEVYLGNALLDSWLDEGIRIRKVYEAFHRYGKDYTPTKLIYFARKLPIPQELSVALASAMLTGKPIPAGAVSDTEVFKNPVEGETNLFVYCSGAIVNQIVRDFKVRRDNTAYVNLRTLGFSEIAIRQFLGSKMKMYEWQHTPIAQLLQATYPASTNRAEVVRKAINQKGVNYTRKILKAAIANLPLKPQISDAEIAIMCTESEVRHAKAGAEQAARHKEASEKFAREEAERVRQQATRKAAENAAKNMSKRSIENAGFGSVDAIDWHKKFRLVSDYEIHRLEYCSRYKAGVVPNLYDQIRWLLVARMPIWQVAYFTGFSLSAIINMRSELVGKKIITWSDETAQREYEIAGGGSGWQGDEDDRDEADDDWQQYTNSRGNAGNGGKKCSMPNAKPWTQVLGVTQNTPFAEVKKQYRTLAFQRHPDKPGGSTAAFQELNDAFEKAKSFHGQR